jgi:hypothetical protein
MQRLAGNRAVSRLVGAGSTDGRGVDDEIADARLSVQRNGGGATHGGGAAATPVAVRNGPGHSPIDTSTKVGMAIDITLTSSTGRDADMASILDSEQVSTSINHTGSFRSVPSGRSNNSGLMAGYPIPADHHSESKANIIATADKHGGAGTYEREQLDTWKPNAAAAEAAIPNSGYVIRRCIIMHGTGITLRTEKEPRACHVNGFTSSAGPSPRQFEDVEVRAPARVPSGAGQDAVTQANAS